MCSSNINAHFFRVSTGEGPSGSAALRHPRSHFPALRWRQHRARSTLGGGGRGGGVRRHGGGRDGMGDGRRYGRGGGGGGRARHFPVRTQLSAAPAGEAVNDHAPRALIFVDQLSSALSTFCHAHRSSRGRRVVRPLGWHRFLARFRLRTAWLLLMHLPFPSSLLLLPRGLWRRCRRALTHHNSLPYFVRTGPRSYLSYLHRMTCCFTAAARRSG
mmetsp:Transcript_41685/g.74894  ORF Transcript_41685/g.74894 Transcript_41685/m.74894 type:complete len:215 (-) Transcript_41685:113-757(-)